MVPVHAFPRPLRSLESFTGRIGNYIEHFIWFAIGLHGRPQANSHISFPSFEKADHILFR